MLFQTIQSKDTILMRETAKLIQLHRRTLDLYLRELERADRECDWKRAADIKNNKIPLVEENLIQAKQSLLKNIAKNAFEVIDKM